MIKYSDKITVDGKQYEAVLLKAEKKDGPELKRLYDAWLELKAGLTKFESRAPNLPEGISGRRVFFRV